jgi:lysophospholipid acyltransferase (LPLAT)-like uncharacterized protein
MWRKLRTLTPLQRILGHAAAGYLWLVRHTNSVTILPEDIYERVEAELPVIVTFWHGQHFLAPFIMKPHHRGKVLISRHPDAEINAIAAEVLGVGTIRGSGTHRKDFHRKGAVAATREMLDTLAEGVSVAMTADVPKVSRVAGRGVVTLARYSGRPIYPIAIATSRRIVAKSWDKASIHLPFGSGFVVAAEPVHVAENANDRTLEGARRLVQERLNWATVRAEELAGRRGELAHGR